jgi:hypothetical protein
MTHGLSTDQEQNQMPQSFHEIQTCSQERTETMNQHLIILGTGRLTPPENDPLLYVRTGRATAAVRI